MKDEGLGIRIRDEGLGIRIRDEGLEVSDGLNGRSKG